MFRAPRRCPTIVGALASVSLALATTGLIAAPADAAAAAVSPKLACSEHTTYFGFIPDHGYKFAPGGFCLSDGTTRLAFQSDGNLVLYKSSTVLWASNTATTAGWIGLQTDGNVVIYNSNSKALWASKTGGHGYDNYAIQLTSGAAKITAYNNTYGSLVIHQLWRVS